MSGAVEKLVRSERVAAFLLLAAAILGLVLANTAPASALLGLQDAHLGIPAFGLDLSIGHWISDGLLAVFFFLIAIELRHELSVGELRGVSRAVRPAVAALGGVLVPAVVYLAFTAGTEYTGGWPVPTATDVAFALGVLAIFGRSLPGRIRVFLLALAVLDDLVAIMIIAFFFTADADLTMLGYAAIAALAFAILSGFLRGAARIPVGVAMVVVALTTWIFVYQSGVHATIAGVVLGLVMARKPAGTLRHVLEPYSNVIVLPLFAFSAALVAMPQVALGELAPPFWGILVALPVGKLLGITLGGWLGSKLGRARAALPVGELVLVAALGGIGFTVSLLMNDLAFTRSVEITDEGTLAVLLGSAVSIVVAAVLVSTASRRHAAA